MRPSRTSGFASYPLAVAAAALVVLAIAAIVAEVDLEFGEAGALAVHAVVVTATALAGASFALASVRLMRGEVSTGPVVVSGLVFITAVAISFSVFLPGARSWPLLSFPY